MFSGIVSDIGEVTNIESELGHKTFAIKTQYNLDAIGLGQSISCDGCCMTVVKKNALEGSFSVTASIHTLAITTLGNWTVGQKINTERSIDLKTFLDGGVFLGHVDDVAVVKGVISSGASHEIFFEAGPKIAMYIAYKGTVAIAGVAMTVNSLEDLENQGVLFSVNAIPHTWQNTNLKFLQKGSFSNIEADPIARYVERIATFGAVSQKRPRAANKKGTAN